MNTKQSSIDMLAARLLEAERTRTETDPFAQEFPEFGLDEAYAIQRALLHMRGGTIAGLKAALTSKAKQRAMHVDQPGYGVLLESMRIGEMLQCAELIHPRVEPEIALFFDGFRQTGEMTASDVLQSVTALAPALEIIDSRYKNFSFTAVDVYADNCSSARYTVSSDIHVSMPQNLDLAGVVFEKNGEVMHTGAPAAVLGSPLHAAALVLNLAFRHALELPESFILLTGGITEAVPIVPGDCFRATFHNIGEVKLHGV